jgi:hypothetical protein
MGSEASEAAESNDQPNWRQKDILILKKGGFPQQTLNFSAL